MTWIVRVCDCAQIFSDAGVVVNEKFLDLRHAEQEALLRRGLSLWRRALDLYLDYEPPAWWHGLEHSMDGFDRALAALERKRKLTDAARKAKKRSTSRRRAQFNAVRDDLVLKMLDAGIDYECSVDGCGESELLTVDHIHPLSRGGTDALKNLQFLCRRHNSEKGDRCDSGCGPVGERS